MKNNYHFIGGIFLLCSSLFVACSDESMGYDGNSQKAQVLDTQQDLTYGTNLFVSGLDSLADQRIPLNTDAPVEVINHNGIVSFDCVSENGKYYLRPKMLQPLNETTVLDKVTLRLPGDEKQSKELLVSVRKPLSMKTRADVATSEAKRFAQIFSYGFFPSYDIGEAYSRYPSLDTLRLQYKVQVNTAFIHNTTITESSGNSLEEANKNWGISVGLDNIPLTPSGVGKASASLGYKSENKKKSSYQYAIRSKNYESALASVNWDMVDSLYKYIAPDLNRILNTNNYPEKYDTTEKGTFQILDDFGPYIPSMCILGARMSYTMSKKRDLEMSSNQWDAQVKAVVNNSSKAGDDSIMRMSKDQLEAFKVISADASPAPSASVSFNYKDEQVAEQSDLKVSIKILGGNALTVTDYTKFAPGDNPKNWIPLAYSGKGQPADLFPLYKFVVDKKSKRYEMLKKYIDGDSASVVAYYKHRNEYYDKPEKTRWVLAGLKMVVSENENFAPFKAKCPDGEERVFYPMKVNSTQKKKGRLQGETGKVLDTQKHAFGACGRRRYHIWYYALALHDECPGIKSIRFATYKDGTIDTTKDEIVCMMPEEANTGTGWSCSTKDAQLVVTPIAKDDKESVPITAFALSDNYGNIFASTGGTEYGGDAIRTKNFNEFWRDENSAKYRTERQAPTPYGIYWLRGIIQPSYLYFNYSTKPLDLLDDINSGYRIEHPTNMVRGSF